MDFLLDNPLAATDGLAFLVLYGSLIVLAMIAVAVPRSNSDNTDKLPVPVIPPGADPHEIATNLYINSQNIGYDWRTYLDRLPLDRVVQVHFVGVHRGGVRLIDAHADPTGDDVWNIFREICVRCDIRGAILERDANLPEFSEILTELATARAIMEERCSVPAAERKTLLTRNSAGIAA